MVDVRGTRLGLARSERVLLLLVFCTSLSIFVLSFNYEGFTATYPQFLAAATLVVTVLLSIRNLVPRNIVYEILFTSPDLFSTDRFADEKQDDETPDQAGDRETGSQDSAASTWHDSNRAVIGASTVAYLVLGFLIGLLWATPIYVAGYLYWMDASKLRLVGLTVLSFGIAFAFQMFINVPLNVGLLHEVFL